MGRLLGIDYGDRRIGISTSDTMGMVATPKKTIHYTSQKAAISEIAELIKELEISKIIVGLPLHMSGEEGELVDKVRAFVEKLKTKTEMPIELWDERLSSAQAQATMHEMNVRQEKKKQLVDQLAAQLILQSYLDSQSDTIDSYDPFEDDDY